MHMTYEGTAELRLRSKYLGFLQIFRFFAFIMYASHLHASSTDLSMYIDFSVSFTHIIHCYTLASIGSLGILSTSHAHTIGNHLTHVALYLLALLLAQLPGALLHYYGPDYQGHYYTTTTTIIIIGTTLLAPRLTLRHLLSRYRLDCPHLHPVLYRHRRTFITSPASSHFISTLSSVSNLYLVLIQSGLAGARRQGGDLLS